MTSTFSKMAQKVTNKIDQMGEKNRQGDSVQSTNYGPHSSNAANTVDPRVDSNHDGRNDLSSHAGGYGNTQGHNTGYSTTAGPGGFGSNTNDPAYNSHSTNAGPHNSNMMNKLDPRVDSDRDGRNDPSSRVGGFGTTQHGHDGYNTAGGPGGLGSSNTGYENSSSLGGAHAGTHQTGMHTSTHNTGMHTGTHNTGMHTGTHNTGTHTGTHDTTSGYNTSNANNSAYSNPQSTNAGPHNSNLLNKLDPRVDSDQDGRNNPTSHTGGYGQTQTGYGQTESGHGAGIGSHTGTASAHHATTGHGHIGSNTASYDNPQSTTAGPHKSNLLNKLDPRVDSDRDGRNDPTSHVGGYGQTQTGHGSNTGAGYGTTTTTTTHPTTVTHTTHNTHAGHHDGSQGYGGANTSYDNPQSANNGPHKSNLMNKLDPRVDSDRDGLDDPTSRVGGHGNTQTGGPKYY